jgi:hypothetical protein
MSSSEILPGFATAQFRTDNPVLTPKIYMSVRDAMNDVKGRRCYIFIMFFWKNDERKRECVVLKEEAFEPTNTGFLMAKALLKEQAILKLSQCYVLEGSVYADLDEYQAGNQHAGQKTPSFMEKEVCYVEDRKVPPSHAYNEDRKVRPSHAYREDRKERPSHAYQLGAEASQRDRVLAWCDQNRYMLEGLSPEAIVLAWIESGNKG